MLIFYPKIEQQAEGGGVDNRVHHIRFFFNKKNLNSSCGSPEYNMEPKNFFIFLAASRHFAGGQKAHI